MTRDEFPGRFGTVFENRPDLAAGVWDRGPPDPARGLEEPHGAFAAVLMVLPADGLTAFLNGPRAFQTARRGRPT